mmetsp:Transcript_32324/g.68352  ORF Transcript_32324/g.68352 Transcript_32324/m.68352 type:complete len:306 (-) Transcript_32324:291-1208(-)
MKNQSSDVGCHRRSSTVAVAVAFSVSLLLSLQTQIQSADAFSTSIPSILSEKTRHSLQSIRPLNSEVETFSFVDTAEDDDEENANKPLELTGALKDSRPYEFELKEHKPLGCSVEESLANEPDGAKYVFVAEVTRGGNADLAGLKVGDVIVQLSGTFDEVVDVNGLGIEKIRSLVGGRPEESPLIIRIARDSDVMERHELALVELCIIGDDASTAECISTIYKADDDVFLAGDSDMAMCDEDDGTECMLDAMWSDWSLDEDKQEEVEEEVKVEKKKKVQPWSSRSSPSGTYVRNPKTGKLENIDE